MDLPISDQGELLHARYRADLICFGEVVVELKATAGLAAADEAQLLGYLRATGHKVGLLLNFGQESLQYQRRVK